MTKMLASVTGPAEAEIALAAGADILDLKDPSRGAFGAVDLPAVRATIAAVAHRRAVSAVTGEMAMEPRIVAAAGSALVEAGADYVKQGFFPGGDPAGCICALAACAMRTKLVAVLFADQSPDFRLLPMLAEAGFAGAMLDTAVKDGRRLLDHLDLPRLRDFVAACRTHCLFAGLAGALEAPDVPRLLVLAPWVLGFRGALCGQGGRASAIDPEASRNIRALIPPEQDEVDARKVDYTLLAARGYAPDPTGDPALHDRIFVSELTLPVRIGVYAREHAAPQRVRFSVAAAVARPPRPTADLRDVVSYDLITDAIRMLTADVHIPLVETLAERIAATLLAHPRVVKVTARLEKLDTGAGVVGVEIERSRTAAPAIAAELFARDVERGGGRT